MITKLEVGVPYKLTDKGGYLLSHGRNAKFYKEYFKDDCITIDSLFSETGMVLGDGVIHPLECKFFEVKNSTTLSAITLPFGELDNQTKKDLLCAWVDGAELEVLIKDEWVDVRFLSVSILLRADNTTYRVKPAISAKDSAKTKLILDAQQQLRKAQETLDKLQKL